MKESYTKKDKVLIALSNLSTEQLDNDLFIWLSSNLPDTDENGKHFQAMYASNIFKELNYKHNENDFMKSVDTSVAAYPKFMVEFLLYANKQFHSYEFIEKAEKNGIKSLSKSMLYEVFIDFLRQNPEKINDILPILFVEYLHKEISQKREYSLILQKDQEDAEEAANNLLDKINEEYLKHEAVSKGKEVFSSKEIEFDLDDFEALALASKNKDSIEGLCDYILRCRITEESDIPKNLDKKIKEYIGVLIMLNKLKGKS